MSLSIKSNERNYGIDLLRCVAMLYVVIIHIFEHGGVLKNITGANYYVGWGLFIVVNCAVDIYVIISGYVGYGEIDTPIKYSKIICLWGQVVFYCAVAWLISDRELRNIGNIILPITTDQYWFFTRYAVLYLLMPILNRFLSHSSVKDVSIQIGVISIVFFLYSTIVSPVFDPFQLSDGYSILWFIILYLIGGWLKKTEISNKYSTYTILTVLVLCYFTSFFMKTIMAKLTMVYFGQSIGDNILISYISPTTVLAAISYVALFSKLRIGEVVQNMVKVIAPSAFAVYLLHDNRAIRYRFVFEKFIWISELKWWSFIAVIFSIALAFFAIGVCIDKMRSVLMRYVCKRITVLGILKIRGKKKNDS